MNFKFLNFICALLFVFTAFAAVKAQNDINPRTGKPNQEDIPKSIKETIVKGRIEREKKEHEELIKRGEESAQLGKELEESFAKNSRLGPEDQKKLERLEKNLKKIRSELGGDNDDIEEKPLSADSAFKALQSYTLTLVDELKKTTRYTISASAIETSNAVLKIVRFIRLGKN